MKKLLKRLGALVLAFALLFGAAPLDGFLGLEMPEWLSLNGIANAFGENKDFELYDSYGYVIKNSEVEIVYYDPMAYIIDSVVIPNEIDGYPVTSIGPHVLYSVDEYRKINLVIPANLKNISTKNNFASFNKIVVSPENKYFYSSANALYNKDRTELLTIYNCKDDFILPDSVTKIDENFINREKHPNSINVSPNNKNFTSENGSLYSKDKTELIYLSRKSVKSNIEIPKGVKKIGKKAFANIDYLNDVKEATISIPDSVENVAAGAFSKEVNVAQINVDANNKKYSSLDGVLFNKDKTALIAYPSSKSAIDYKVPQSVNLIENEAFYYCSFTSLVLPDGIKSIGESTFENVTISGPLVIPASVTEIGTRAFKSLSCHKLTLNEGLITIGDEAFASINVDVAIPDSVQVIGNKAFNQAAIETLKIPSSTKKIGNFAFSFCNYLKGKVIIPKAVESIGQGAFCMTLTKYEVSPDNSNFYVENDALIDKKNNTLLAYPANDSTTDGTVDGTAVNELKIPEGIKRIGYGACAATAIKKIIFPQSLERINDLAFYGSQGLDCDAFPQNLKYIGTFAFVSTGIRRIEVPKSVETICSVVFMDNEACEEIIFHTENLKHMGISTFSYTTAKKATITGGIKELGDMAFTGSFQLTEINLPDTIEKIGKMIIQGTAVTSIKLPKNLKYIDKYALGGCSYLKTIEIPEGVSYIGGEAFGESPALSSITVSPGNKNYISENGVLFNIDKTELMCYPSQKAETSYKIPATVKKIAYGAFYKVNGLTGEFVIPDSVEEIGRNSLGLLNVTSLVLGKNVKIFGVEGYDTSPISNSNAITQITFRSPKVPKTAERESIAKFLSEKSDVLKKVIVPAGSYDEYYNEFHSQAPNLIIEASKAADDFVIENNVVISYSGAGGKVVIPNGVTGIGEKAFIDNKNITSVVFPEGVTSINHSAFENCVNLKSVTFADSITNIGSFAFDNCNQLDNIVLPQKLESIGSGAFSDTAITSINIPANVHELSGSTFSHCLNFEKITVDPLNKNFVSENGILFTSDKTEIVKYPSNIPSADYTVSDNVTVIGNRAFDSCVNLKHINLGKNLKVIETGAFDSCKALEGELVIPDSVTAIRSYAFSNCNKITSIVVGSSVKEIGDSFLLGNLYGPFDDMSEVRKVTFKSVNPPERCSSSTKRYNYLEKLPNLEEVYVPLDSYEKYYQCFENKIGDARIIPNTNEKGFIIKNKVLIAYTGEDTKLVIPDEVERIDESALKNNTQITEITLSKNTKIINDNAFKGCTNLKSVHFNDKLTQIGDAAFMGCNALTEVLIPDSVTVIGNYAFNACTSLAKVSLGKNVEGIGFSAFSTCKALSDLTINDKIEIIAGYAFYNCPALNVNISFDKNSSLSYIGSNAFNLTHIKGDIAIKGSSKGVTIKSSAFSGTDITSFDSGDNVTLISSSTFQNCLQLKTVTLTDKITDIEDCAFQRCSNLTSVRLPETLTQIKSCAFDGCTSLKDINISNNITGFAEYSFRNCSSLTDINLSNNVTQIGTNAFEGCTAVKGTLIIPESITTIGSAAFKGMTGITKIIVGTNAVDVPHVQSDLPTNSPFLNMTNVSQIIFKGLHPLKISTGCYDLFSTLPNLKKIYVPYTAHKEYVAAYGSYVDPSIIIADISEVPVSGLQTPNVYSKTVKLDWDKHQSERVTSYIVERDGVKISELGGTEYIDTNLEIGKTYTYIVYGITDTNEKTGGNEIKVTTAGPSILKSYAQNNETYINVVNNKVFAQVKNTNNAFDLNAKQIKAKLYIKDGFGRKLIGESSSISTDDLLTSYKHEFNLDISGLPDGNQTLIFVYTDPDGISAESELKIEVDKSVPQKIENVVAVGDYENILISWNRSAQVSCDSYEIYRKSSGDKEYQLISTIKGRDNTSYTDKDALEETEYSYYVVAKNSRGAKSEISNIASAKRLKDTQAPRITKVTPKDMSFIFGVQNITVTAIDNVAVANVKLYYSVDNGTKWTLIGEDTNEPFAFTFDTTKLPDTDIKVKAVAYDAKKNESSAQISTYRIDNSGPEKVTGLKAKQVLSTKITLEWNNVSAEDAACFVLEQKTPNGYVVISDSITTLGYNITNLMPGETYTYRVAAIDIHSNKGEYSDEITVKTVADVSAPVVTELLPGPGRFKDTIPFSAVSCDDFAVKKIEVQISTDLKSWKTVSSNNYASKDKRQLYKCEVDVSAYKNMSVYIRAIATDWSGNVSDSSSSAPFVEYYIDSAAPSNPMSLSAQGGDGWILIQWAQGSEDDISGYQVYRAEKEEGPYQLIAYNIKSVNHYDKDIQREKDYFYKVRVCDTVGNLSDFSQPVKARVNGDTKTPEILNISPKNGSTVGPNNSIVRVMALDNSMLESGVIEYKINGETEYKLLEAINNIGASQFTLKAELPLKALKNGDKIYIRAKVTDTAGLCSDWSKEYVYTVDTEAPGIKDLNAAVENDNIKITWSDTKTLKDISGYKVYRVNPQGGFDYLGSRSYSVNGSYVFYDFVGSLGAGNYTYRIDSFDKTGNTTTFLTNTVNYAPIIENKAPVANIIGRDVMEINVEEIFDAGNSTDDSSIVSYFWDFGDGTTSNEVKVIKKYNRTGNYLVTLTVTDEQGLSSQKQMTVQVGEKSAVGTVEVVVYDENGSTVYGAPVYFDLGSDNQKVVYTNSSGAAAMLLNNGNHVIGVYKEGYLPADQTVTVLPNATRRITITIVKDELVTGDFTVNRMTFDEIKNAGIDIYAPENQNVYAVTVQLQFGEEKVPVKYVRNDKEILDFEVGTSGGFGGGSGGGTHKPGGGSGGRPSKKPGGGTIEDIGFIPNKGNKEIIAVLEMSSKASYLKEFFDVKLHVINNAEPDFELIDSTVNLNIPRGLSLINDWDVKGNHSSIVDLGVISGRQSKTCEWILRGDKEGDYNLSADFNATLARFNEPVSASFATKEPITVFGLSNAKFIFEINESVKYGSMYYNIGIENTGTTDIHNPKIDFDGLVTNITTAAKREYEGTENTDGVADDSYSSSTLLNVRLTHKNGKSQYLSYSWNKDGSINIDLDMLAPGESLFYEYVSYNAIDYDGIAYLSKNAAQVLAGYGENVEVRTVNKDVYSMHDAEKKIQHAIGMLDVQEDTSAPDKVDLDDYTHGVLYKKPDSTYFNSNFLYDDSFFRKSSTQGVNAPLAAASANIAADAFDYKQFSAPHTMGFKDLKRFNYERIANKEDNDFVAHYFTKKEINVNGKVQTLVLIAVRGTPRNAEWISNFNVGTSGVHEGFKIAAKEVMANYEKYAQENKLDPKNTKLWITGINRGGAVANIIAEEFTLSGRYASKENIYAYTFGAPAASMYADTSLENIFNYCNNDDFFCMFPLTKWGFKRAGKTFYFDMTSTAKTAFLSSNYHTYVGTPHVKEIVDAIGLLIPSVYHYNAFPEFNNFMLSFAYLLAAEATEGNFAKLCTSIITSTQGGAPNKLLGIASAFNNLKKLTGFFANPVLDASSAEAYIAYLDTHITYNSVASEIKSANGIATEKLDITRENAMSYILDDSNYMYFSNSDLVQSIAQTFYNELSFFLWPDVSKLTHEDQKKMAQDYLLELIMDEEVQTKIEMRVDMQYINGVVDVINEMKNYITVSNLIPKKEKTALEKEIDALKKSTGKIEELAFALKNKGDDQFITEIAIKMGLEKLSKQISAKTKAAIRDKLQEVACYSKPTAVLYKSLAGELGKGAIMIKDYIEKPILAYQDTMSAKYLHSMLKMCAADEEANFILDTIINSANMKYNHSFDIYTKVLGFVTPFAKLNDVFEVDVQEIVINTAKQMKEKMHSDFNEVYTYLGNLAKQFIDPAINKGATKMIQSVIGKCNPYYVAAQIVVGFLDNAFGIDAKLKSLDGMRIITYIGLSLSFSFAQKLDAYKTIIGTESFLNNYNVYEIIKRKAPLDLMMLLKGLCKTRLIGEKAFREIVSADNSTWTETDEWHDANIIDRSNLKFGTDYNTVEDVFDYIYSNLIKSRDAMFNVEYTEEIIRPEAPTVTLDYERMKTRESFSDLYEYCMGDGEWRRCEDKQISFSQKTTTQTLRVRKAAFNSNPSGEIRTVTILAKRELNKNISVKYDNGCYYFNNLWADAEYEYCTLNSRFEYIDWSKSRKIRGRTGASSVDTKAEYIAIRSLENLEKMESVSQTLIIPVNVKQHLDISVWGSGTVSQNNPRGEYFVGDTVYLEAKPNEGSTFEGWYINGKLMSPHLSYMLEMYEGAEITAKFNDPNPAEVETISIIGLDRTLYTGMSVKLNCDINPKNAADKSISWSTSNANIAVVDSNSTVRFTGSGNVTITATAANGVSKSVTVFVRENKLTDFYIFAPANKEVYEAGEELDLTGLIAVAKYTNGDIKEVKDYTVSGFDKSCGNNIVKLSYKGMMDEFNVTVNHSFKEIGVIEATCETGGYTSFECEKCGHRYTGEYKPALGHIPGAWHCTKKPTAFEEGSKELRCSRCNKAIEAKSIPMNNDGFGYSPTSIDNTISGLPENTTPQMLSSHYRHMGLNAVVTDSTGATPEFVGTGDTVKFGQKEYVVVLKGDVTGGGSIDVFDSLTMNQYLNGEADLVGAYKQAGLIVNTDDIDVFDNLAVTAHINGESDLNS